MLSTTNSSHFLEKCQVSSNLAFESFKELLAQLEHPDTRREARIFLGELAHNLAAAYDLTTATSKFNFAFINVDISNDKDQSELVTLLQFPSTFTPEEWSYTFFEGLSRYQLSDFQNKTLVELGCGNGWITLAMAKKYGPSKIYGLDINPRAIICSKINLYLNALDDNGNPIKDINGCNLLDVISFYESDLLHHFYAHPVQFDIIFGCIPQVLNPEGANFDKLISESQNDDFLYSLSNYCSKQGFVEDQFGLGLIAKSLEQGIDLLKPGGKMIFNIGGRPGRKVLERLFERRGFHIVEKWQRKVIQAGDTEITPLIEIENQTPHRFEFYMGLNSDEPISAKTAKHYADNGGQISHTLTVYECTLPHPAAIKNIFSLLKDIDYEEALGGLDLCFENESISEEKTNFLSALTNKLKNTDYFPYSDTKGEKVFRKRIAQYLNSYFYTGFDTDHLLITPNVASLLNNVCTTYTSKLIIAGKEHARFLDNGSEYEVVEVPQNSTLLVDLIEKLHPDLVFFSFSEEQNSSVEAFKSIVEACKIAGARLFVDISQYFELNSLPKSNGVLKFLSQNDLPLHVGVICGLVKNQVYTDLEVCFLLSQNKNLLDNLANSAEFSYSRTPLFSQLYYSELLFELLKFQMVHVRKTDASALLEEDKNFKSNFVGIKECVEMAYLHPAIKNNELPISDQTIRLDYGENELSTPKPLKAALFESFTRQNITKEEVDPSFEIKKVIYTRFGLLADPSSKILYGNGVAPLFSAIVQACKKDNGTLVFPKGAYGYFYATALYYDCAIEIADTHEIDSFKFKPDALAELLKKIANPWVFVNFPLINPTGARYSNAEMEALLSLESIEKSTLIVDAVFSGLEFQNNGNYQLEKYLKKQQKFVLLGGISKEFAGGGLRFGYALASDVELSNKLFCYLNNSPHDTILYACKKIFERSANQDAFLSDRLSYQSAVLKERAQLLTETLEACGWSVLPSEGGLFLVAKPVSYFNKKFAYTDLEGKKEMLLNATNIHEALFYTNGLLINNDVWTGIPEYCRFVLSISEKDFLIALSLLKEFNAKVLFAN